MFFRKAPPRREGRRHAHLGIKTRPGIVFAFTPSAAASERVFSLLKNMFGADQKACLADYIQAALMRAYNKRKVG